MVDERESRVREKGNCSTCGREMEFAGVPVPEEPMCITCTGRVSGLLGASKDAVSEEVPPVDDAPKKASWGWPMSDPWEHRSAKMQCKSCMWYVAKGDSSPVGHVIGRCRRHAPTMNGYPAVFPGDWCGDHKVDETKI